MKKLFLLIFIIIIIVVVISIYACTISSGIEQQNLNSPSINGTSITQGPFVLYTDSNGLLSLLYDNRAFVFKESGLEFMYNGEQYLFPNLSKRNSSIDDDSLKVMGIFSDLGIEFTYTLIPHTDKITIQIEWDAALPPEMEYCNLAIHLNNTDLRGQTGYVQTIMSVAAEMYITTKDPSYFEEIKILQSEMYLFNYYYPSPDSTTRMNYIYAGPFLAGIYNFIYNADLKSAIFSFLEKSTNNKAYLFDPDSWPFESMINKWYGQNGNPIRLVYDHYYISKVLSDKYDVTDTLPLFYWLFGMHPLDSNVYIIGLNDMQPSYQFSMQFVELFKGEPKTVPGAVISGLNLLGETVYFTNELYAFNCVEPIIDVSAALIFAAHALG